MGILKGETGKGLPFTHVTVGKPQLPLERRGYKKKHHAIKMKRTAPRQLTKPKGQGPITTEGQDGHGTGPKDRTCSIVEKNLMNKGGLLKGTLAKKEVLWLQMR